MMTELTAPQRIPPEPVRRASKLMIVLAVLTFAGTVLVALGMATVGGIAFVRDGNDEVGVAAGMALAAAVAVAILAGVLCWLAIQVRRGRAWARAVATVMLVAGSVITLVDAIRDLMADPIVIPLIDLVQLGLMATSLALLWGSPTARNYFTTS